MAKTVIGVGDAKAIHRQSALLAYDVGRTSYFNRKFMGVGEDAQTPIQTLTHLENDAGDKISYDLVLAKKQKPIRGDEPLKGKEENMKWATDSLLIDQLRGGTNAGGKMTRKRTLHDMRKVARRMESEWWARLFDETLFMYLSGMRGNNADFIEDLDFAGYAGNAFVAPDDKHIMYGGDAVSKQTLAVEDVMTTSVVERLVSRAKVMGGGTAGIPKLQPCNIDGSEHYVLVMHPWQAYDMRVAAGATGWLEIQKAAAGAEGRSNPIFKGGLGMINNVILHDHEAVITAGDYGAANPAVLPAARALFLGRQAAVVAFGSPGTGLRFDWNEEMDDRGNQLVITTASIFGVKKSGYTINGTYRDFGCIAVDTAAKDPS
jgi:N4-gp56 family major capsid protein